MGNFILEIFYSILYYYSSRLVWLDLTIQKKLYYFSYHDNMVVYLEVL
jgi:hypothetical protein